MNELQINNLVLWSLLIVILVGVIGHFFIYRILLALTRRTKIITDNLCIKHCYRPFQWIVVLLIIRLIWPVKVSEEYLPIFKQTLSLFFIGLISLLFVKATYVSDEYVIEGIGNPRFTRLHFKFNVTPRVFGSATQC